MYPELSGVWYFDTVNEGDNAIHFNGGQWYKVEFEYYHAKEAPHENYTPIETKEAVEILKAGWKHSRIDYEPLRWEKGEGLCRN